MKDLISRQELIDRCNRVIKYGLPDNNGQHQISVEVVLDVVKDLPSETTDLDNVIAMIEEDISEYEELIKDGLLKSEWERRTE